MPLPPIPDFLRPKPKTAERPPIGDEGQAVQAARTRARQRLVGALVLLALGVVAFPLLFETEPRPLSVDTPIKLTQRDSGTVRAAAAGPAAATAPAVPVDAGVEEAASGAVTSPAAQTPAPAATPASVPSDRPVPVPTPTPAAKPAPAASVPVPNATARVAPAPKPAPPATAPAASVASPMSAEAPVKGRFVVQVGAFSDARTLREARQKVERLGLKTYTQVIDSPSGQRTRVRVGPFDARGEAEAAARTLQGGGLPAAILAL